MAQAINVSFPPKDEPLLVRIIQSKPNPLTLAEHARILMRQALDCTCSDKLIPRKGAFPPFKGTRLTAMPSKKSEVKHGKIHHSK